MILNILAVWMIFSEESELKYRMGKKVRSRNQVNN